MRYNAAGAPLNPCPLVSKSFGTATAAVAKASEGYLLGINASNTNASLRYLQVFNRATTVTGGETPIYSFPIPAGTATAPGQLVIGSDYFGDAGALFQTGIVWGVSTARATYTAGTNTDHQVHIHYS